MVGGEAGQEKSGRRLDYSGSESGLFVGLLALVSIYVVEQTIPTPLKIPMNTALNYFIFWKPSLQVTLTITLILYFSLVKQERFQLIAVLIINITDTVINLIMIAAIIIGFVQVWTVNVQLSLVSVAICALMGSQVK